MKQLLAVASLVLSLLLSGNAFAQTRDLSTSGEPLDRIAAVVNDGVVLNSQLDQQIAEITARLRQQNTELPPPNVLRRQVLERLVVEEIQVQRAAKLGIQISDEMLNGALDNIARSNGIAFSDLPRTLEQQGIDYRTYRDEIRRQMTLQMLRQRDVIGRINISPREMDQAMQRAKSTPDQNLEYNISHILISVPVTATPEQIEAREKRMQEAYEKAKAGEDFAQLAVTYSDSTTNIEGGSLGWRKGSQLPSIVSEQVVKMQAGQVSQPIRTPSGFHLFRLNETRGSGGSQAVVTQVHARHILLAPNELEDDQTLEQKLNDIRERVLKGEDFAAIAAVTSQDPGSAADGGDLGWAGPGTFVPEFEKQLSTLGDNEISKAFKTQYGWHIIQLLGRRQHDTTEDKQRQQVYAQLRESKAEEETELWLRKLRDEAFVEYRM